MPVTTTKHGAEGVDIFFFAEDFAIDQKCCFVIRIKSMKTYEEIGIKLANDKEMITEESPLIRYRRLLGFLHGPSDLLSVLLQIQHLETFQEL